MSAVSRFALGAANSVAVLLRTWLSILKRGSAFARWFFADFCEVIVGVCRLTPAMLGDSSKLFRTFVCILQQFLLHVRDLPGGFPHDAEAPHPPIGEIGFLVRDGRTLLSTYLPIAGHREVAVAELQSLDRDWAERLRSPLPVPGDRGLAVGDPGFHLGVFGSLLLSLCTVAWPVFRSRVRGRGSAVMMQCDRPCHNRLLRHLAGPLGL